MFFKGIEFLNNLFKTINKEKKMAYKKVIGNYQSNFDFSPDLVGFQITEGSPLMTLTNFYTTPTTSTKNSVFYETQGFSQPVTLSDLNLTSAQSTELLNNNLNLVLNPAMS